MDKEMEKTIDRLSNEICKYNINAIDYPSVIVLREDVAKLINLTKKLQQQLKKKDEAIEKAIQFIQNNGEKQYNYHDNYRGKWYSPDELDTILELLEDKEVE